MPFISLSLSILEFSQQIQTGSPKPTTIAGVQTMPIQYEASSFVPHFSEGEMISLQSHMLADNPNFAFDPVYVEHIKNFNGGKPITKYFRTSAGRWFPIDRFLHFSNHHLVQARELAELNVNAMWSAIGDRLTVFQFPFAILPGGDFLCFDHEKGHPPRIVLWYHEGSKEEHPRTEEVADSFRKFMDALQATVSR